MAAEKCPFTGLIDSEAALWGIAYVCLDHRTTVAHKGNTQIYILLQSIS